MTHVYSRCFARFQLVSNSASPWVTHSVLCHVLLLRLVSCRLTMWYTPLVPVLVQNIVHSHALSGCCVSGEFACASDVVAVSLGSFLVLDISLTDAKSLASFSFVSEKLVFLFVQDWLLCYSYVWQPFWKLKKTYPHQEMNQVHCRNNKYTYHGRVLACTLKCRGLNPT